MPRSRSEVVSNQLQNLLHTSSGLDALSLVSMDGGEIASALLGGLNHERLAAMTLAAFTLSQQIGDEFQRGGLQELYIRGKSGFIVLIPIGNQAILAGLAREDARPGLVLLELRHIAEKTFSSRKGTRRLRLP
jgi:predicted regulator of Ras-like GTPase activity (Roadblock/LC7/MglB family)